LNFGLSPDISVQLKVSLSHPPTSPLFDAPARGVTPQNLWIKHLAKIVARGYRMVKIS